MGDISEDIRSGFQCSECGTCFNEEHGFPVLCAGCFYDYPKGRAPYSKAKYEDDPIEDDKHPSHNR